jgi:hypothetical protein
MCITKPKRNADFRAKSKGLCIFIKSLNLMDLALDKKRKSKTWCIVHNLRDTHHTQVVTAH